LSSSSRHVFSRYWIIRSHEHRKECHLSIWKSAACLYPSSSCLFLVHVSRRLEIVLCNNNPICVPVSV
jgi:hypothetical protein